MHLNDLNFFSLAGAADGSLIHVSRHAMPLRIAVIGAGVSGLTAAYRLAERHQVTLLEANDYLGGHTNTVDVALDGERHAIDVGFVVFNERNYPHFSALLNELGIASRPTSMGFSVRCDRSGLEYSGSSLGGLFAQRSNLVRPRFYRLLADILRFNRQAPRDILEQAARGVTNETTVGEYLERGRYSREFVQYYLLPMGSAIWSCPLGTFAEFPIRFIVEFFRNHGLLDLRGRPTWRVVDGGSRTYVEALLRRFRGCVRVATPIARVRRLADRVEVTPQGTVEPLAFDHVVFACHSDQALAMLADPSPTERELLSAFPYERSTAVLHTDQSLLPRRRRAWASWNYHLEPDSPRRATVTYCMNILQGIRSRHVFNVTLNCDHRIAPEKVLRRFTFEHPIFTTRRAAAQSRHGELIDANRTSYCGAYWRNGFHEDGVVSALAVCRTLNSPLRRGAATGVELSATPGEPYC